MAGKKPTSKKAAAKAKKPAAIRERATPDVVRRALAMVESGSSLRAASEIVGVSSVTMLGAIERHGMSEQYARACEIRAEVLAEQMIEIADVGSGDVQRDRLRYDARKWFASKLAPKKYGDKVIAEHSGPDGGPVQVESIDASKLSSAALKELLHVRRVESDAS